MGGLCKAMEEAVDGEYQAFDLQHQTKIDQAIQALKRDNIQLCFRLLELAGEFDSDWVRLRGRNNYGHAGFVDDQCG